MKLPNRPTVLVVEDDAPTLRAVSSGLEGHGYAVIGASSGEDALRAWELGRPDLVLLDLGLPGMSGMDVIRRLRRDAATPILILSARDQERDKVEALDLGADDYVTKPFGMGELQSRVHALLRRSAGPATDQSGVVRVSELELDATRHEVRVAGNLVPLTPREFELLRVLVTHAGSLVTKGRILRAVWGTAYAAESHYVHVYISQIRRKLSEADPTGSARSLIIAEPGIGYRIQIPEA